MLVRLAMWLDRTNWRSSLRAEIAEQVSRRCALEVELRAARREAEQLRACLELELQATRVRSQAVRVLSSARHRFTPLQTAGLLVDLPTCADGSLDEAEFAGRVFDAAAAVAGELEEGVR